MNCWYRIPLLRALPLKNGITSQKKQGLTSLKHNRGNNMTKKTENKNTITVKQSNNLGLKLTDVRTGLQALRQHSNTLMLAKHAGADNGLLRLETDNFLETVFDMVEIYSNELDRVAFYLLECDNPEELRAYEAEEKGE